LRMVMVMSVMATVNMTIMDMQMMVVVDAARDVAFMQTVMVLMTACVTLKVKHESWIAA
jgi:hypothetical protein